MTATTYRQAGRVARNLGSGVVPILALFMAIILVVFMTISVSTVLIGTPDGSAWDSVWEDSAYATRYFPLAMGILLVAAYLPVAVASGVTRRSFGLGSAVVIGGIAVTMAVLEAAGYLIEYMVYRAADGGQELTTPHLFSTGTEVIVVIAEVTIVVAAHVATGWLIGAAYYRWGWQWPTLALPLLIAPALLVEALMSVGWAGALMIDTWGIDRGPLAVIVPGALLALVVTWLSGQLIIRAVPIRTQRA